MMLILAISTGTKVSFELDKRTVNRETNISCEKKIDTNQQLTVFAVRTERLYKLYKCTQILSSIRRTIYSWQK